MTKKVKLKRRKAVMTFAEQIGQSVADVIVNLHKYQVNGDISKECFDSVVSAIFSRFGIDPRLLVFIEEIEQLIADIEVGKVPVEDASGELEQVFNRNDVE